MLTKLYIENIAVIEKTEINFECGLNVLTGETGAGKSIVIDSINAILGKRASRDLIRADSDTAFVSATFSNISNDVLNEIQNYGFSFEEDKEIIIQREFSLNGRTSARLNGRPIAMTVLRAIGDKLINIHGQHESYGLFFQGTHIKCLDEFGALHKDLERYKDFYQKLKDTRKNLSELKVDENEKAREIDLLNYQISELESADLKEGELETLASEKNYLLNKEKISMSIERVKQLLGGDEETPGAVSLLELANEEISKIKDVYTDISEVSDRFSNFIYEVIDCQSELMGITPENDEPPGKIDEIEERLSVISNLSRKYGPTISQMNTYLENIKMKLEKIQFSDQQVSLLEKNLEKIFLDTSNLAKEISAKRKKLSKNFTDLVKGELSFLDMPNVSIEVSQRKCDLNQSGCDEVEFLISTNPGQPARPISKIASGGELSRLMLAIKNVLSNQSDVSTLIFDEIDTGISGGAARKVGLKLKELSASRQVICVTHLSQIACIADKHFLIEKTMSNNKTFTNVVLLNFELRKKELARIMSGSNITDLMLKNAEEMLKSSLEEDV